MNWHLGFLEVSTATWKAQKRNPFDKRKREELAFHCPWSCYFTPKFTLNCRLVFLITTASSLTATSLESNAGQERPRLRGGANVKLAGGSAWRQTFRFLGSVLRGFCFGMVGQSHLFTCLCLRCHNCTMGTVSFPLLHCV